MKRNRTLFLSLLLGTALTVTLCVHYFGQNAQNGFSETETEETISGAYQALNFIGARTVYPNNKVPEKAHYAAWELSQKMPKVEENGKEDIDPWESIGPHNRGGRTLAIEFNPQNTNTIFIGTASGGLWKSYTGGIGIAAWEYVETGFPVLGVSTIAFPPGDSTTMYIGTGEVYNIAGAGTGAAYRATRGSYGIGILKSTDGGLTWEKSLDWSYNQNHGVWMIKIDPSNSDIIYAATTDGVYKSINAGVTWVQMLNVVMANDLVIHPNDPNTVVVGCGNFGSTGNGIYKSTNGGVNWTKITNDLPDPFNGKIQLNYAPSSPDILYASYGNGFGGGDEASWLCRSTDFGSTWEIINQTDYSKWQGWFAHDVAVSPSDPNHLSIIGIDVWKSVDGGYNIYEETTGGIGASNPPIGDPGDPNVVHSDCHDVKFHPTNSNMVYVASDGGVHLSLDGGETFQLCTGGLQNCQFYNGFSNSNQDEFFAVGGLQDNGTILWNGDLSWQVVSGGDGSWTAVNPQNDNIFYTSSQGLNVRRFNDGGGSTFMSIPQVNFAAFIAPYVIYPGDGNILYAGNGSVAKTNNGGNTWSLTNGGAPLDGGNPVLSMDIASENSNVVYAATAPTTFFGGTRGNFFVTTNGGANWINRTGNLPDRYPMDVHVDPTNEGTVYVTYSGFGTGHVFKSTDYAQTWEDISGDLPDVPTNAVVVDPLYPDNIYVGNDLGVFVSIDGGENWQTYQMGLNTATMIFDLKISPVNRKLRAATHGNGAYQRDLLEDMTNVDDILNVVADFKVFPNPASDYVKIFYELLDNESHSLHLIDGAGRLVKVLVNDEVRTGIQEVEMEVGGLGKGIYYVQMISKKGILTEKLTVVK